MRNPNNYAKYKGRYYNDAQSESDDDDSILDDFVVDEDNESESESSDQSENSCTSNSQKNCKDSPKRPKRLDSASQSTPDSSQEVNVSKSARKSAKRLESSSSEGEQSADQQEEVRVKRKRRKARVLDSDGSDSNEPEEPRPSGATPRPLLRSSSRNERLSALKKQQDDETKQEWRRKRQQSLQKRLKLDVSPKQDPEPIKEEAMQILPVVCADTTEDNSYSAWKQAGAEVDKPRFVTCQELYRNAPNLLGRRIKLIGRIVDILEASDEGYLLQICGSNTEHKCQVKIPLLKNQEDKEKFKTGTVVEFCGELEDDQFLKCTFFLFPEINLRTFNLSLHEQSIVAGRKYGSPHDFIQN